MRMFDFDLQLFGGGGKGGGSSTTVSKYEPSQQELQLQQYALDNANIANSGIKSMLNNFNSGVQSEDFKNILGNASGQIKEGQATLQGLQQGQLSEAAKENITSNIADMTKKSFGDILNKAGASGVINSSVMERSNNDIAEAAAKAASQGQLDYMNAIGNFANAGIANATAGYKPYSEVQALVGKQNNDYVVSPLSALSGKGTTTSTQEQSGMGFGDFLMSAALGLGTGWVGKQMGLGGK